MAADAATQRRADAALLSDAELLAALLHSIPSGAAANIQLAEQILAQCGGLQGLARLAAAGWPSAAGLTADQTGALAPVFEIARRLNACPLPQMPVVNNAEDAARLTADMRHLHQEHVRLILLDANNHLIAMPTIYIGTLHGAVVRVAEVLREALLHNSPGFILVHNHPAGSSAPSPEDIELTRTLAAAARLVDMQLLDHLIIGAEGWHSLKQQGLTF